MPAPSRQKVGLLLSAGGAAFERAVQLSQFAPDSFHVVVDRHCAAADKARALGITVEHIQEIDRTIFSCKAATAFKQAGCGAVLAHFSRLVGPELFASIPTFNVHPSLLPAFPGLTAIEDAAKVRTPFQGATLHVIDAGVDTGPILAQTVRPVPFNASLAWRHALGYRQKVVMTLLLLDWINAGLMNSDRRGREMFHLMDVLPGRYTSPGFVSETLAEQAEALFQNFPGDSL